MAVWQIAFSVVVSVEHFLLTVAALSLYIHSAVATLGITGTLLGSQGVSAHLHFQPE